MVVDDEDRENEGDLVIAAEKATPEIVAFMMSECRGLICAPMEGDELDRLELPQMVEHNTESMRTAFTVSVDAVRRARRHHRHLRRRPRHHAPAARRRRSAEPTDFVRPGHIFPLRAKPGGVLVRNGHTEAAVDLARLAGLRPAGAIVEIAGEDGAMLRLPELIPFARKHGLTIISIEDLIAYRRTAEPTVRREAEVQLPTAFGEFTAYGYRSTVDGVEHVALVHGEIGDGEDVLVRVHSECLTGDVFHSLRCDCGPQLQASLERITGRGPRRRRLSARPRGPRHRPAVQAARVRTPGARPRHPRRQPRTRPARRRPRLRAPGAQILEDLGVRSLRLMTNNPDKTAALVRHGLEVTGREPMPVQAGEHNLRYLRTKRDRMGHDLPWLDTRHACRPAATSNDQQQPYERGERT